MGSINRKITVVGREVVDVSKEIVIDAMYMTTDLLHAIRNNLPIELSTAQLVEATEREEVREPVSGRRAWRVLAALVVVTLIAGGAIGAHFAYDHHQRTEALGATHTAFWKAVAPVDTESLQFRSEAAVHLNANSDHETVLKYLDATRGAGPLTTDESEIYLVNVMKSGDIMRGRTLALDLLKTSPKNEAAIQAYTNSFVLDPRFTPDLETLEADKIVLSELEEDSVDFNITLGGQEWVWITATVEAPDRWQTPVSAYRLCAVIACEFGVREARPVAMSWTDVTRLFEGHDELLAKLQPHTTPDGDQLQGALVQKRERAASFPVERTRAWRRILDADRALTDKSAAYALKRWKKSDRKAYKQVKRELKETSSSDLARQVSSLMVFDYITGNYRRFSRRKSDYGQHVGVEAGQLWSEQEERIFGTRQSKRLKGRIKWVERFSQANIQAVQATRFDLLAPHLFPGETQKEAEKARLLSTQAKDLVRRVDALTTKHGQEILL